MPKFFICLFGSVFLTVIVGFTGESLLAFLGILLFSWFLSYHVVYDKKKYENGDYKENEIEKAKGKATGKSFLIGFVVAILLNGLGQMMKANDNWGIVIFVILFILLWIYGPSVEEMEPENKKSDRK